MEDLAWLAAQRGTEGSIGDIVDVDKGTHRVSAAMEFELLTQGEKKKRARDDTVELLPRTEDIGCAGEDGGEVVLADEGLQMQIARRAGRSIRRARIEWCVFADIAGATAVDFRRGDMDVFFETGHFAESVVQTHIGHDIGLIPVLGVLPAFRDHALRGEIDHVGRVDTGDGVEQFGGVDIEVKLREAETREFFRGTLPAIRQKNRMRFRRAAGAKDFPSLAQAVRDEACAGKRVATDYDDALGITHWVRSMLEGRAS